MYPKKMLIPENGNKSSLIRVERSKIETHKFVRGIWITFYFLFFEENSSI